MLVLAMGLKVGLFLLDLSLTPFQLFHESQHPCYLLNTRTRPMFYLAP
jgi:hypothetical protein